MTTQTIATGAALAFAAATLFASWLRQWLSDGLLQRHGQ